jgi:hypothetical protein
MTITGISWIIMVIVSSWGRIIDQKIVGRIVVCGSSGGASSRRNDSGMFTAIAERIEELNFNFLPHVRQSTVGPAFLKYHVT